MSQMGHGLQIVSLTKDHKYQLNKAELEHLLLREDVRDLPVVVVSVAGAYRGGKSFLLNFFLRYLSSPVSTREDGSWLGADSETLVGFQWRSGIKATTMGVLMWSEPFITTLPSGEKVAILLVDTQGNFDSKSTVRDNSTIFALSTLVSSIQIFNLSQNIKEDDLQHLALFTAYGKLTSTSAKAFQVLEFLVRDWQFDDYPMGPVGGEQLLHDKFEITADLDKEMRELRQNILSSFEKVSCFLMPHPGFDVLSSKYKGNISAIAPAFREQIKVLANSIFGPEKLIPKKINGERVNASHLFNLFQTYIDLFNSDKMPNPTTILEATVKAGLLSAVSEAREFYEKRMDSECGPAQKCVPLVDLKYLHKKYVALALDKYTKTIKMGSPQLQAEYKTKLSTEINERLEQFVQSNLSKILTTMNKAKEAYDAAIKNVTKDAPLCVHAVDLETIHKLAVEAGMLVYDAATKRVTQKPEEERSSLEQKLQEQYELLRKTNKQNNIQIANDLKGEYWEKMQPTILRSNPISEPELMKDHENALKEALKNFESKRNIHSNYNEDVFKFQLTQNILKSLAILKNFNESKNKDAIKEASNKYTEYMKQFWDKDIKCMHPGDLEDAHQAGKCHALAKLRPTKQCPSEPTDGDKDETTLYQILNDKYQTFESENDNANEVAVEKAYNVYNNVKITKIIGGIGAGGVSIALGIVAFPTLLVTVPAIVAAEIYISPTQIAIKELYSLRRKSDNTSRDRFLDQLMEKIG